MLLGSSPGSFGLSAWSVAIRPLRPSIGVLTDSDSDSAILPPSRSPNSLSARSCNVPTGLVGPAHFACGLGVSVASSSTCRLAIPVLRSLMRSHTRCSSSSPVRVLSPASPPLTLTPAASLWLLATPWTSPLGLSSRGIHVNCDIVVLSFGTLPSSLLAPVRLPPSSDVLGSPSGGLFLTLAASDLTLTDSHSCALWPRSPHFRQGPLKPLGLRAATCGSASPGTWASGGRFHSGCTVGLSNRVVRYL